MVNSAIKFFGILIIFFYMFINLLFFVAGYKEQATMGKYGNRSGFENECMTPTTRLGKFFPTYRWGCYMGESAEESTDCD